MEYYLTENLTCLICKMPIRSGVLCEKYCTQINYKPINEKRQVVYYDYDQIIDGIRYRIWSGPMNNQYLVFKGDNLTGPVYTSKQTVISLSFQHFTNQQEFEQLLPKLLKMKAFL